ncbi:Rv1476 family membrane protein, partial [Mycobacterium kansasii]
KAAEDFATVANDATFPWTGFTVGLMLVVAALAGWARVVTRRRSRAVDAARRAAVAGPVSAAVAAESSDATVASEENGG